MDSETGFFLEHAEQARKFLDQSEKEFADDDVLQGSEKLWGAACQAVMAVAKSRGWDYGKSKHRSVVIDRLVEECGDSSLASGYSVAQKFHANFYNNFMEDDDIARDRPIVHQLVQQLLNGELSQPRPE